MQSTRRKAIRVGEYSVDNQCEQSIMCERTAAEWTVEGGNGYVVACELHARDRVQDAVDEGEIVDAATLEPFPKR